MKAVYELGGIKDIKGEEAPLDYEIEGIECFINYKDITPDLGEPVEERQVMAF